uniref:DUF4378 domain-containing protein n=1 Tax=Heterorhabditis bacteriophora TaxID=37862 RepID=A0A1I7WD17_HETBA
MEDELSFSDRESISSDSDRQNDGSIKAKRSKRDHELECDSCIKERLDHLTLCVNMCDSGCQTEAIISSKSADPVIPLTETKTAQTPPTFNQRIVKKATSTKAKKGVLKAQSPKKEEAKIMPSPESPASPDPVADEELAVAESLGEFGSQKRAVPRMLPMEYAMKFYEEQAEAVTEEARGPYDVHTPMLANQLFDREDLKSCRKILALVVDKEVIVPDSKGIEEWLRQNMTTCWKTLRPGDKRPATVGS